MKSRICHVPIELFASLEPNGVCAGAFVGPSDEAQTVTVTWEELIDEVFSIYALMGYENDVIPNDALDEVVEYMNGLVKAAELFKERLKNAKSFDRDAWVESNNGSFDHKNINEFIKEINCDK